MQTTPIYFVAPKPHLGQYMTLAQRLHDMVVGEELTPTTPKVMAPDHWSLNTALDIPFDIWQPLRSRHNFHSKYSPSMNYGYSRVHTASLFSPHDEILESSRKRLVTEPIGSRSPKFIIAPSTTNDPRPSNLAHTTPPSKARKVANLSPIFLNEKILWKLRSMRGSQRQQFKHDSRHRSYSSTTRRARILGGQ